MSQKSEGWEAAKVTLGCFAALGVALFFEFGIPALMLYGFYKFITRHH